MLREFLRDLSRNVLVTSHFVASPGKIASRNSPFIAAAKVKVYEALKNLKITGYIISTTFSAGK